MCIRRNAVPAGLRLTDSFCFLRITAILVAVLLARAAQAVDALRAEAMDLDHPAWRATGLRMALEGIAEGAPRVLLAVARVEFADGYALSELRLQCPATQLGAAAIICGAGEFAVSHGDAGRVHFEFQRLRMEIAESGTIDLSVAGLATHAALAQFSQMLGWPRLEGRIAAPIEELRYVDGELRLIGPLRLETFGGRVQLDRVRIADLLGVEPVLEADIDIERLDLRQLTGTFAFGKIEGGLDGRVRGLRMAAWELVAFDATFATPADDDSRHLISQRAVDNLANLGGGGNVISQGFLQYFDEFSYDRLGISCRLEDGVCEMGGVAQFPGGYFLVTRGALPPWIDVKAYSRHVDWTELLARLRAIMESEGPVVE